VLPDRPPGAESGRDLMAGPAELRIGVAGSVCEAMEGAAEAGRWTSISEVTGGIP